MSGMPELNLSDNMRNLRAANEYSQQEVSDMLHIARQTSSLYETGKRIPDTMTVCRLADIYQIPVETLLFGSFVNGQLADHPAHYHTAAGPDNSCMHLNGADAKMLMDYKSFPMEVQREVREFIRFKKHLLAKDNPGQSGTP